MPSQFKIISLNIEGDRHYATCIPFLKREDAHVIALQEVLERDMPFLTAELGLVGRFAAMEKLTEEKSIQRGLGGQIIGIALFVKFPAVWSTLFYAGAAGRIPLQRPDNQGGNKVLLCAQFKTDGDSYSVGTTHFTWTPDGNSSAAQQRDLEKLCTQLRRFPEIAFCGDFNMPRGREMWARLAARYTDNIPLEYTSSIDPNLHWKKGLAVMVDGLFTTPAFEAFDVRLVEGVSDHKAVVGYIRRR